MKIRITNNKIRYRLKQQEVEIFRNSGIVTETLLFGNSDAEQLKFSLLKSDVQNIGVNFQQNHTIISVPSSLAKEWTSSTRVGFEAVITKDQGTTIHLLVEKDFMCLDGREEDNEGSYPNPQAAGNR